MYSHVFFIFGLFISGLCQCSGMPNDSPWYAVCFLNVRILNANRVNQTFRSGIFNCVDCESMLSSYCVHLRDQGFVMIKVRMETQDHQIDTFPWRTCTKQPDLEVAHAICIGFSIALLCLIIYLITSYGKWKNKLTKKQAEIRKSMSEATYGPESVQSI